MKKLIVSLLFLMAMLTETAFAASVNVAVIDTGIKNQANLLDETRILTGRNYILQNEDTRDLLGHGTAVASLILGTRDGTIVSCSNETNVVPLVYYTKYASGEVRNGGIDAIAQAIYDAVDEYGCRIVNLSSGVAGESAVLKDAIDYAEENHVLVVSASGNDAEQLYYPAAYDSVIAVGSHDEQGEVSVFSGRGAGLTLLASGEDLTAASIANASEYREVTGTSFAAARVTAAAAAVLEAYPELRAEDLRFLLMKSCIDVCEEGYDETSGFGILSQSLLMENAAALSAGELLPFLDVDPEKWNCESIRFCVESGIAAGVKPYYFAPEKVLTRAEFVTMLYRAAGEPEPNQKVLFSDIPEGAWFEDAAQWAAEAGIVRGTGQERFSAGQSLTMEELLLMLYRFAGCPAVDDETALQSTVPVHDFAEEAVHWSASCGLAREVDFLDPAAVVNRGEAAVSLAYLLR